MLAQRVRHMEMPNNSFARASNIYPPKISQVLMLGKLQTINNRIQCYAWSHDV